jgi:hypothetical protein
MPNPVAVNDLSPISGSLQTSRISYAVETAGKDYGQDYNGTTWYSDIPQNGSQYTIITDNYTANYYVSRSNAEGAYVEGGLPAVDEYSAPVFWLTAGTSSLDIITIVNGLPDRRGQIPFNSGSQALNWVASSSNYFAVGPPYEQIDADNLRVYVDANQIISYPTTGSTWYDLSGYTHNGTLENGLTWNPNGWFDFDGSDDDVNLGTTNNLYSGSNVSWEVLFNADSTTGYRALFGNASTAPPYVALHLSAGSMGLRWEVSVTASTNVDSVLATATINRWQHFVVTYDGSIFRSYLNGVTTGTASWTEGLGNNTQTFYIGKIWAGVFNGLMNNLKIYQKTLSVSDVTQNYYQGPVVTGSISGSYYANNLVSYVSGSTNTYNLSANIISGSLQNGVGFSPLNGGYWSFDGTDDQILLEGSTTNAWSLPTSIDWTVNAWIRTTTTANALGQGSIFSNSNGGPVYSMMGINAGVITYWYYLSSWVKSSGTIPVNDGKWHMLTWVNFAGGTMNLYVDGGIDTAGVGSNTSTNNALDVIGASWVGYFQGDIASLQINKGKAFTASEVLQQYNATK